MSQTTETAVEPVRKELLVDCSVEHAWAVFTDGFATWWPLATHSIADERAVTCVLEPRVGGRLFERTDDGSEHEWGTVVACEPPRRLVVSWRVNPEAPAATEWEVRFGAEGSATRVELEHRRWELLGEGAVEARARYEAGWEPVLAGYVSRAAQRAPV